MLGMPHNLMHNIRSCPSLFVGVRLRVKERSQRGDGGTEGSNPSLTVPFSPRRCSLWPRFASGLALFAALKGGEFLFSAGHIRFSGAAGSQELFLTTNIERG